MKTQMDPNVWSEQRKCVFEVEIVSSSAFGSPTDSIVYIIIIITIITIIIILTMSIMIKH